jgi:hypothetical protein
VRRWKAGGLSAPQYAEKHDLNPSTLMWWASAMKRGSGSRAAKQRRRIGGASSKKSIVPFLPVRIVSSKEQPAREMSVQAEILLEGGRRVRLVGAMPIDQLARLLDVVEGGARC